jgi:hypothetical protein
MSGLIHRVSLRLCTPVLEFRKQKLILPLEEQFRREVGEGKYIRAITRQMMAKPWFHKLALQEAAEGLRKLFDELDGMEDLSVFDKVEECMKT